jgi:uncharacterized protein (DUF4415 family)
MQPTTVKTLSGRILRLPTDEEDARIRAGIEADPDTHEVSDAEFAMMRRPGRPMGSGTKTQITLRLDTAIVEKFKATGPGWQTNINAVLRDAVAHGVVKAG